MIRVLGPFPFGDDAGEAMQLAPLHVDDGAHHALAERTGDDRVGLERVERSAEVLWQGDRVAQLEPPLDAVAARGQGGREQQVRVRRGVADAQLDARSVAILRRHAQIRGAVVATHVGLQRSEADVGVGEALEGVDRGARERGQPLRVGDQTRREGAAERRQATLRLGEGVACVGPERDMDVVA